jgi:hypothetical protein
MSIHIPGINGQLVYLQGGSVASTDAYVIAALESSTIDPAVIEGAPVSGESLDGGQTPAPAGQCYARITLADASTSGEQAEAAAIVDGIKVT